MTAHGGQVAVPPADGASWQVYCNRAWVFTPVSIEVVVDHCTAAPCQHAGRCVEQADGYVCLCAPGTAGVHCEEETCTSGLISQLQLSIDAACCAQLPAGVCTRPPPPSTTGSDDSGTPLFALPDSCSEAGCAAMVAEAFAQCERRIYNAQRGGAGLSAYQELLAGCQSGH
jgi:hypothetical protein